MSNAPEINKNILHNKYKKAMDSSTEDDSFSAYWSKLELEMEEMSHV